MIESERSAKSRRRPSAEVTPPFSEQTCFATGKAHGGVVVDAADYYRHVADAIEKAKRYVLLAGWQLESSVWLRRLPEDEHRPRTLAEVIRAAVDRNPDLEFWVLAWDWASVYALDREWGTGEKMIEAARGRLHFRYDSVHPQGGSHHEKFVVIDGHTAWIGGIDLCEHRWDERAHADLHPMRFDGKQERYGPYHDVQAVVRGDVVGALVEHFVERWETSGGTRPELVPAPAPTEPPPCHVSLGRAEVALSRTRGATVLPLKEKITEIEALYVRALRGAERLVYIESQYVTSHAIAEALVARMRDRSKSRLEIVLIMPECLEGRMEKVAIDVPQRAVLATWSRIAREQGHAFGAFFPCGPARDEDGRCSTYVHSKLMIVDDRFLTIGSANATNRSMGLDSEINVSWWSRRRRDAVERGIRALRVSLLAEHTRASTDEAMRRLVRARGLVANIGSLTRKEAPCILPIRVDEQAEAGPVDQLLASFGDPDRAALAETVFEELHERPHGVVAKVVTALREVTAQH